MNKTSNTIISNLRAISCYKLKYTTAIWCYLLTILCISCTNPFDNDDDANSIDSDCDPRANTFTNQQDQLFFIEPMQDTYLHFSKIIAHISIPNTISNGNLLEESTSNEVQIKNFNHKNLTLGNEVTVLRGRLEDNGDAFLIYSEDTDNYELLFEITLERLGQYTITNYDNLDIVFKTPNSFGCFYRINTSSQDGFLVIQ